jgi:hypothetical protein
LVVEAALGAEMGLKRRIESLDVVVFEPNVRIGWLRWYRFLGSGWEYFSTFAPTIYRRAEFIS